MAELRPITPCLWFDNTAYEAMHFYLSIFRGSRALHVIRCGAAGPGPAGSVLLVEFELNGQRIMALNGGPMFQLSEAASLVVHCDGQEEVDYYWERLSAGGAPQACGWLKDRFGLSWQILPVEFERMMRDSDLSKVDRTVRVMLTMQKLDLARLRDAFEGRTSG